MFAVFRTALQNRNVFTHDAVDWATARYGTDEELVEVCRDHGANWYNGGQIEPGVDALLKSELSTRVTGKPSICCVWPARFRTGPFGAGQRVAGASEVQERVFG